jgi:hypothetical protein
MVVIDPLIFSQCITGNFFVANKFTQLRFIKHSCLIVPGVLLNTVVCRDYYCCFAIRSARKLASSVLRLSSIAPRAPGMPLYVQYCIDRNGYGLVRFTRY